MEPGPEQELRRVGSLSPISSRLFEVKSRRFSLPQIKDRASGARFLLVPAGSAWDALGATACLGMWAVLWLLIVFGVLIPLESAFAPRSQQANARPYAAQGLVGQVDPPRWCPQGRIEVDGQCVLGEEIEVRPSVGWKRR